MKKEITIINVFLEWNRVVNSFPRLKHCDVSAAHTNSSQPSSVSPLNEYHFPSLNFGLGQKMQAETRIKPWSGGISKLSGKLSKSYPQATGSTQECGASTLIVLFSRSPSCKIKFPFTHLRIPWRAWCNIFKCNSKPHIKVTVSLKEEGSMVR